ncbi:Rrf2 family transcriptional regulator [Nocardioides sp.]|uniref:RrF2 family transcriptional regulator n=1 Tax=Nocardioides sp. TaxID=35761 RepID=UPI002732A813|nr:Rrf2 family transcriptional regulator [Nocardioides sp.]MDP3892914.1 Rrf2 family transcriptional regulator [Nocardioides sp.]
MQLGRGVEWALHCCLVMSWLEPGASATAEQLANHFGLPKPYLHKQIQALVRAGIAQSTPGPGGGYALARAAEAISFMDVVAAIEGSDPAFRCTEIRQQGVSGDLAGEPPPASLCQIDVVMRRAELTWRRELAGESIASLATQVDSALPSLAERTRRWFSSTAAR